MFGKRLAAFLIAFAFVTVLSVVMIVHSLIDGVSNGANAIDDAKSRQAVQSSMGGLLEQGDGLVFDNAKWDDAVDNVYGQVNLEWIRETWGVASADINYDRAFVLDENGMTLAGYSFGKETSESPQTIYDGAFETLLGRLPKTSTEFGVASGFVRTANTISVMSVAPIFPYSETKAVPEGTLRYLVLSKTLAGETTKALGDRLLLGNFAIGETAPADMNSIPIELAGGTSRFHAYWEYGRPGDNAKRSILLPATLAVGGMILCTGFLVGLAIHYSNGLKRSQNAAWDIANTDSLTGLPNRNALLTYAASRLSAKPLAAKSGIAVILADIDGFKEVNDTYGHEIGDQLLVEIADCFARAARQNDGFVGRLGGDEFALIVEAQNVDIRTRQLCDSLISLLSNPFNIDGRIAHVGVSIGYELAANASADINELLRRSDVAMYAAKEAGKNRWMAYDATLDTNRNNRIELAKELNKAVHSGAIGVAYQPIMDASSGRICGVEALARWSSERFGDVEPETFISVAEEFGIIGNLGEAILLKACQTVNNWDGVVLSVNVSPAQFRDPDFVANLVDVVDAVGFDRSRLEIEVTESYVIEHKQNADTMMTELKSHGFAVVLDDFGSGYSSFGYLRDFHFDRLKLDRSLIKDSISDPTALSIITATIAVARNFGVEVTAEGIETNAQAEMLSLAGCSKLQGYYFSRPLGADDMERLLSVKPEAMVA